jgi:general secretion pathway protein H
MKDKPSRAGFSLVEMLVVLALLAFATVISFPMLQNSKRGTELVAFQSSIVKTLSEARNRALLLGQDQHVHIDNKLRMLAGSKGQTVSFPDTVTVSAVSAKLDADDEKSRFVFFGAGGNSGGKIETRRKSNDKGSAETVYVIALNWFTGEISSATLINDNEQ